MPEVILSLVYPATSLHLAGNWEQEWSCVKTNEQKQQQQKRQQNEWKIVGKTNFSQIVFIFHPEKWLCITDDFFFIFTKQQAFSIASSFTFFK